MVHPDYEYDEIAEKIFYPAYDEITDQIIEATGITRGKFLDVGCGGGHLGFSMMKKTGMDGTFVDIKEAPVEITKIRAGQLGVSEKTTVLVADVEDLPFEDGSFQLVISRGSVPFWENQEKAFREIFRVLAPGGKAYIGGGLGSGKTRRMIKQKMAEQGLACFGSRAGDQSRTLSDEAYAAIFDTWPCKYRIISDPEIGNWKLIEKTGR